MSTLRISAWLNLALSLIWVALSLICASVLWSAGERGYAVLALFLAAIFAGGLACDRKEEPAHD